MTRQLVRSHDRVIFRLLSDVRFCERAGRSISYSRLTDWIPVGAGIKTLELGCGPGRYVALLGRLGGSVVGVDPVSFPTWARISQLKNVEFHSAVQAEALPFSDGEFDACICIGALLYFDSPDLGLSELHRVLKPGSRVVLRSVNRTNLYTARTGVPIDPASKNLYTMMELVELVEQHGFRVVERFSHGFFPSRLTNFWWYAANVILPNTLLTWLSSRTPTERHVNNSLFLTRI